MAKLAGILEVLLVLNYGLIFAESSGGKWWLKS